MGKENNSTPVEQKFFHCAFAARESRRDERQRRGGSRQGGLRARKMSQWLIFTEERAGRPWLCPPAEGCATAPSDDYPLTAPATMPLMIWLLKQKYSTTIGLMVISIAVICSG